MFIVHIHLPYLAIINIIFVSLTPRHSIRSIYVVHNRLSITTYISSLYNLNYSNIYDYEQFRNGKICSNKR